MFISKGTKPHWFNLIKNIRGREAMQTDNGFINS